MVQSKDYQPDDGKEMVAVRLPVSLRRKIWIKAAKEGKTKQVLFEQLLETALSRG